MFKNSVLACVIIHVKMKEIQIDINVVFMEEFSQRI